MPRNPLPGEKDRYLVPLPSELRQRLAFVIDARGRRVIAPWLRDALPRPSDEARLEARPRHTAGASLLVLARPPAGAGASGPAGLAQELGAGQGCL